ncbi:thyroid transcription factor 1-associated protein 26 [Rhinatrema bivittatum]|uniref:thyroid transcription factor 1-associated protein 26 n=1 Tax=Rhinatrema bivittatum TaxID=194408 RepID=UPI00112C22FF|nr:thyroid transcription factor 1-associated protein 26 [Rhinatrema bivittatum]
MAPVTSSGGKRQRWRREGVRRSSEAGGRAYVPGAGLGKKRKWRPMLKHFAGSKAEGQGFALWRKQKIQQEYKKLLRKEKRAIPPQENQFTENYPEHLKHLYLAEEEMVKKQRKNKDKQVLPEEKDITVVETKVIHKAFKRKTSNEKAKEEYEKVQTARTKQREEAAKRQREREEAQKLYKQKKMETYKILSKKTKKGQPNLNLQMEYLLQKIQQA